MESDDDQDFLLDEEFEGEDVEEPNVDESTSCVWSRNMDGIFIRSIDWNKPKNTGIQVDVSTLYTPLDIFRLFFTDSLIEHIVNETNRYANLCISKLPENKQIVARKQWKPLTIEEFYKYLSALLFSGIVQLKSWKRYWSDNEQGQIWMKNLFHFKRFKQITKYLHFDNNDTAHPSDPLGKIRTPYNYLRLKFQQLYIPTQHVVIDEGIIPFKGRVPRLRQYIPRKPHSTGVKYWMLADSNSYLWYFEIYTGKDRKKNPAKYVHGSTFTLIRQIESKLPKGNYVFYFDNYFASERCCMFLHQQGRSVVCTHKNNGIFKTLSKVN